MQYTIAVNVVVEVPEKIPADNLLALQGLTAVVGTGSNTILPIEGAKVVSFYCLGHIEGESL